MRITARVNNTLNQHVSIVATEGNEKQISIAGKATGGSSINGGELLFLSLATCFCNDLYREAARRNMIIENVEVSVTGEFGKEGEPGYNIEYQAAVQSPNSTPAEIEALPKYVDSVAEVHNTLRKGVTVTRNR